ncbi:MAG: sugar ABC transporter permease [Lachnospiraceae bacterium]|nr:sugar ABC transporter permease [Lachnospiraceae bacterium]
MKKKKKQSVAAYLFIAPSFIIYLIFVLIPVVCAIFMSLTNYNMSRMKFVGFNNYIRLLKDSVFIRSVGNTVVYSLVVVGVNIILGLVLAAILNQVWFRGSGFCRAVFYVPYIISTIAASMIWLYMYDSKVGVINGIFKIFKIPTQSWLQNEKLALGCLILMGIWQGMGYCLVVYFSALRAIPAYLYEAAEIDGASKIAQFFKISVPMLSSTTFFLLVMCMISSFQVFAQIMVMTGGGPLNSTTMIAHQIYVNSFTNYSMGYATSQAVVLFMIILVLTLVFFKYGNREGDGELD